ncbi:SGNH family hydrolase [Methyloligella sp. 2.7D]|uniref:SGNH/GDSL hydrolase family protein n=1 Tax=unclassified Methyloligella TaxID=2625955 RepID=UPI001ABA84BD|nr:SGNH family hydrolase [Methyloligella sp. GL2]
MLLPVLGLAGISGFAGLAAAQNNASFQRSYIDPFPRGDRYRVLVLGDSLGDGLWSGLYRSFDEDKNLEIIRRSKVSTGFVRTDYYDWNKALPEILEDEGKVQIAVVMFGANDGQSIRENGKWYKPGTDEWREIYGKRVETFLRTLRENNIATYWVGLPVMRTQAQNQNAELMNDIFREKAFIYGTKFIETWAGFTDEAGRYSAYGPDMTGQTRRLRANDGVHFTQRGYLKLAHFVGKEIRRDLSLAKEERNIPLAGSAEEQARVMGRKVSKGAVDSAGHAISVDGAPLGDESELAGEQAPKLEESTVGGVALLRPAMSETLEAGRALMPQGAAAGVADGERIASELDSGLIALASISPISDLSVVSSKPRLPLAERPYYRVLVKGEQLPPKDGRADDFRWPPQQ